MTKRPKPPTNDQVTDWVRDLQDEAWDAQGPLEGFFVRDDHDREDFLNECENDDADGPDADTIADLVWPD